MPSAEQPLISIEGEKLLFVEGKDEVNFFDALFKALEISEIQIIPSGGKQKFKEKFRAFKEIPDFVDQVKALAVMHDADTDAKAAFQSICHVLEKNQLPVPEQAESFSVSGTPKTGAYIIPGGGAQGNLEALLLSTVQPESLLKCIDRYMDCAEKACLESGGKYKPPKNEHKARCRAFLSVMEKDISTLGVAAQKGYWDWQSEKLQPLIKFLRKI